MCISHMTCQTPQRLPEVSLLVNSLGWGIDLLLIIPGCCSVQRSVSTQVHPGSQSGAWTLCPPPSYCCRVQGLVIFHPLTEGKHAQQYNWALGIEIVLLWAEERGADSDSVCIGIISNALGSQELPHPGNDEMSDIFQQCKCRKAGTTHSLLSSASRQPENKIVFPWRQKDVSNF